MNISMQNLRKFFRLKHLLLLLVLLIVIFELIQMNYHAIWSKKIPEDGVVPQLRFLQSGIQNGMAEEMQQIYPEGFVFLHALYGLSWTEVARYSDIPKELRAEAFREAERSLAAISAKGSKTFLATAHSPHGAFYCGWRNLLLASLHRAKHESGITDEPDSSLLTGCEQLAKMFNESEDAFPETYPGTSWPADVVVAATALQIGSNLLGNRYDMVINKWKAAIRQHAADNGGLLPHAYKRGGKVIPGYLCGSSSALILRLMPEIDKTIAEYMYGIFKQKFVQNFAGISATREYPKGVDGSGHIDSGPVLFGIGAAASLVTASAAKANNDIVLYEQSQRFIETFGIPLQFGGKKKYAFGLYPMADAFNCWGKATLPVEEFHSPTFRLSSLFMYSFGIISLVILITVRQKVFKIISKFF